MPQSLLKTSRNLCTSGSLLAMVDVLQLVNRKHTNICYNTLEANGITVNSKDIKMLT